jgi:hypothetical protein
MHARASDAVIMRVRVDARRRRDVAIRRPSSAAAVLAVDKADVPFATDVPTRTRSRGRDILRKPHDLRARHQMDGRQRTSLKKYAHLPQRAHAPWGRAGQREGCYMTAGSLEVDRRPPRPRPHPHRSRRPRSHRQLAEVAASMPGRRPGPRFRPAEQGRPARKKEQVRLINQR